MMVVRHQTCEGGMDLRIKGFSVKKAKENLIYLQGIMMYGLTIEANQAKYFENTTQLNELCTVCRWHDRAVRHGVAVAFF